MARVSAGFLGFRLFDARPPDCSGTPETGYACLDPGHCKEACTLIKEQSPWYAATCMP